MNAEFLLLCVFVLFTNVRTSCNDTQAVFMIPGDIHINGIFNGHSGDNCSIAVAHGVQQMAAAASIVKIMQDNSFIPGIDIGISLYDACSSIMMAQKAVVSTSVQDDCADSLPIGILCSPEVYRSLRLLTHTLSVPVITTSNPFTGTLLFHMSISLLLSLRWYEIDTVVADDSLMLDSFEEIATKNFLCIRKRTLLSEEIELSSGDVLVILANGADINTKFEKMKDIRLISAQILLVPLDGELMRQSDNLPIESYSILPSTRNGTYNVLFNQSVIDESSIFGAELMQLDKVHSFIYLQMALDILQIVTQVKSKLVRVCNDPMRGLCSEFKWENEDVVIRRDWDSKRMNELLLSLFDNETETFELFQFVKLSTIDNKYGYSKVGGYNFGDGQWSLVSEILNSSKLQLCRQDMTINSSGIDCNHCINFIEIYKNRYADKSDIWSAVEWKSDTWVAVVLTISVVGIICIMAVGAFITVRLCKQDILEGNPTFTYLLLISTIMAYISCGSYAFIVIDDHAYYLNLFCNLRIFGTSISYSLIFSVMLARSIMIASCDQDGGFMSHISGYLQFVVCFFIIAVQVALSIQFFLINESFLSTDECVSLTKGYFFIAMLGYNAFILILLVLTAPFVMKSKRNYHEGGFFAVASVLCLLIWCGWITAFILLSERWHDMITTCGLCGTATIIVVTIFIPRTYLMMTGIVRDHLASNLPALAYASSSSVVDINYRSTQALYDSVNPLSASKGQINPNFYAERPGTPSTSKMDSIQRPDLGISDNTYERYDTPTSPLNITRF